MGKLQDFLKARLASFNTPTFLRFLVHVKQLKPGDLPWFTRGDLDGFFGLFIDNLLQLMLIGYLCKSYCGFPVDFLTTQVLPGAAISILLGNLFYAWQARQLAISSHRNDVTALPFGINTVSLIAFVSFVMAPVFQDTKDYRLAWQAGLLACFLNGLMEIGGAYVGDWLRKHTPRAALLCALAGIAITFIAMDFIFQIFANPIVGLLPTFLILVSYASRIKWPLSLPGGFLAVLIGTILYWTFHAINPLFVASAMSTDPINLSFYPPKPVFHDLWPFLKSSGWKYFAVIFPMGLFNVVGSIQNLESAEAAGDSYDSKPSLLTNGIATILACFLGSPFPTTIYIGHPGWKAMGARHGYSILNGLVISMLCLVGGVSFFLHYIPRECIFGILLWIAIIITAQAFMEIPKEHSLAVAFGLIPAFAGYCYYLIEHVLRVGGVVLNMDMANKLTNDNFFIRGILRLNEGFLLTSMIFAAVMVFLIDRKFERAAWWTFAASFFSFIGLIHAYTLTDGGVINGFGNTNAPSFGLMYLLVGGIFLFLHYRQKSTAKSSRRRKKGKGKANEFAEPPKSKVSYL